jgi:hypothetical protein
MFSALIVWGAFPIISTGEASCVYHAASALHSTGENSLSDVTYACLQAHLWLPLQQPV